MRLDTSSFAGLAGPVTPVPLVAGAMAPRSLNVSPRRERRELGWSSPASGGFSNAKPAPLSVDGSVNADSGGRW
jgi:hypothetical protein